MRPRYVSDDGSLLQMRSPTDGTRDAGAATHPALVTPSTQDETIVLDGTWNRECPAGAGHVSTARGRRMPETTLEADLAWRSMHDALTELPTRTLLIDHLDHAIARSRASARATALFVANLDRFHSVNEQVGNVAGDAILRAIGELFGGVVNPGDMVARVGGDEFAICCELAERSEAYVVADRLASVLAMPFRTETANIVITASIGIALCTSKAGAEDTLRRASAAMFSAKRSAVGRVEMFDDADHDQLRRRRALATDLQQALTDGDVETYFQPEIDLTSGQLVGFETLARWRHPARGMIEPSTFVPVAEDSGLIHQLGASMLQQSCRALASWTRDTPYRTLTVAVNVSARQLEDPGFPDSVRRIIEAEGVAAAHLCLEVTESALMDTELAATALNALKALGVRIAIDDFGTGYSSLSRLQHFPVDDVKVDQSFVAGIEGGGSDAAVVRAIVGLCRDLGIRTIAEGVERVDQRQRLRELGCDIGQGFLWSPAVSASEARRTARAGRPFSCFVRAPNSARSRPYEREPMRVPSAHLRPRAPRQPLDARW